MMLQAQGANRLVFIGLDIAGNAPARAQLEHLATVSGGRFVLASDPSVLPQLLTTVVNQQPAQGPALRGAVGPLIPAPASVPGVALGGLVLANLVLLSLILLLRLRR